MRRRFSATEEAINGGVEEVEESVKKKQGAGVRVWLLLDEHGNARVMEVGKHAIMRRTGLPARDLRALDPLLSYPSSILGRERAIVINLEHIKAIITAHEILLLNSKDPAVAPFAAQLQSRLPQLSSTPAQQIKKGGNGDMDMGLPNENTFLELPDTKIDDSKLEMNAIASGAKVLPFEFRALEACLEAACSSLESEAGILEEEAYPTLDELTSKVSTLKLERVRQIKSRLVATSGRVQKVRDELEHLLDDDEDMAEMYLTGKLVQQQDGIPSPSSFHGARFGMEQELAHSDAEDDSDVEALTATFNTLGRDGESRSSRNHFGTKGLGVEELEMLLEAYFVQIDGTLNKLSALKEYVDDTEDYINIMLDDKQNHLLQMGVVLTTVNLIINFFVAVAGVLGINIRNNLFNFGGFTQFLWFLGGCSITCILLFVGAIALFKYKRLL